MRCASKPGSYIPGLETCSAIYATLTTDVSIMLTFAQDANDMLYLNVSCEEQLQVVVDVEERCIGQGSQNELLYAGIANYFTIDFTALTASASPLLICINLFSLITISGYAKGSTPTNWGYIASYEYCCGGMATEQVLPLFSHHNCCFHIRDTTQISTRCTTANLPTPIRLFHGQSLHLNVTPVRLLGSRS